MLLKILVNLAWYTLPDDGWTVGTGPWCATWSGRQYLSDYTVQVNAAAGGGTAPTSGWTTVATVTGNNRLNGMHSVAMTGYNWIRLNNASGPNGIGINVDIVDCSNGAKDGWLFLGDSITNIYAQHTNNPWPTTVYNATGRRPLFMNRGLDCSHGSAMSAYITQLMEGFSGKYVVMTWGINDSWNGAGDPTSHYNTMVSLCQTVIAAGKVPVVPTLTWPNNGGSWQAQVVAFNDQIRNVWANVPGVLPGPDLYTLTYEHADWFGSTGDVHPNATGAAQLRAAWGTRMIEIYG